MLRKTLQLEVGSFVLDILRKNSVSIMHKASVPLSQRKQPVSILNTKTPT